MFEFSALDVVNSAENLKKYPGGLFRDFWGQSWKIQNIFKVTKISHSQFYDTLRQLCPSTIVQKFTELQCI